MTRLFLYLTLLFLVPVFSQHKNQSIGFKENKGQIVDQKGKPNNAVKYLLNSGGLNVQIRKNGFSYDIYEVKKTPILNSETAKPIPYPIPEKDKETKPEYNLEYIFHRIDIDFVDYNPRVELITDQESKDFDNYYNVPNRPEGIIGVHQYKQITYKNIYPNIDVVFTIPDDPKKTVEYNFVVHPKGKISDIQLKFGGAKTELIDNKIRMSVRFGEMEETLPASWTEDGELKKEISVGYTKIKKNVYGFKSAENVSNKTLIIDPVPIRLWGTYYGGENIEHPSDVTTNSNNDVFISGNTWSTTNIATSGTNSSNLTGTSNMFFAKLDTNGNRIWGTYFYYDNGLFNSHQPKIKIDSNNNLYFAAEEQYNTNIATTDAFQKVKNNYTDVILVKLNHLGIREWATYYGGNGHEDLLSLCLDSSDNIYISGQTSSTDVMSSSGSHQVDNSNNSNDGFIAKFDPTGNRIWGTFYGGDGADAFLNVSISNDGYLYATGTQNSSSNISTPGAFQEFSNGNYGGMIIKFTLNGERIWGTYICEESIIYGAKIQENNIYLFGITTNETSIATPNTFFEIFQTIQKGTSGSQLSSSENSFIISFNIQTKLKNWGTYFIDQITGLDVNQNNEIYFSGNTNISNGITTPDGYLPTKSQYTKTYLIKLNNLGQRVWGTYYGGNFAEQYGLVHLDSQQNIYIYGSTNDSTIGIATSGVYQTIKGSNRDTFLVKFKDCESNALVTTNSPICIGNSLELKASGGTDYLWTGPNGFTSADQNPIITNASILNSGEYSCTITGTGGCDDTKKTDVIVGDFIAPIPDLATLPTITGDCHTTISTFPTATDACAGVITGTTTNPLSYSLTGTYTIVWNYDDGNGNSSTQNQSVIISSQPLPIVTSPQIFCAIENSTLGSIAITGQNIKWYDELTAGTLLLNTALLQDGKTYYASQTIDGCESKRVAVAIKIQDTPPPTGNSNQPFCSDQNPTVADLITVGQNIKWYDALTNGNILSSNTSLQNGITYYASQTFNSCEGNRLAITVSIQNTPDIPTGGINPKFCKSEKATLNTITINGQNLKWYDSNTTTTPLANTTLVQNNTTYYVSQTIGCESDRLAVLVNVNDTPLPIANASQTFCIDENATIANIAVTGQNLIWYDTATAGTIVTNTTTLENKTYYVTQTNANCESERLKIVIKIQDTQPPIADANQSFCIQQNATINTIKINGEDIKWYTAMTAGTNLSESTPLETGITYYASQTIHDCESGRTPITIQIQEATTSQCINFVDELPYPKFFTPNNDGYNDTWTIDFIYLEPNSTIRIFDRYGKFIKELPTNAYWDGNYLNQPLPSTDYWFLVKRLNGAAFKSHFSLKR